MKIKAKKIRIEFNNSSEDFWEATCGSGLEFDEAIRMITRAWEEYDVSAEPLIKDEKIRKAVRAWAEVNSIKKARVNVSSNGVRGIEPSWFSILGLDENECSWEIEIHADYFETVSKCYKGDMVGITELCGEEEAPEPIEPTFIDLDERIKEKEGK